MPDRYAEVEALIAAEPVTDGDGPGVSGSMRRLCNAAARALSACGTGLTVTTAIGLAGMTAASGEDVEQLQELQFTLGEGPSVDAYQNRRPVLIPDLGDGATSRWPAYAPAAQELGVRSVFAFPLQMGAARLGVMDVFRREPGLLTGQQLTLALTFAEVAVAALISGQADAGSGGSSDGWLDDPLGSRAALFQAQGMVMVQLAGSLTEAMARMRGYAYAHNLRLAEVAAQVISRQIIFDRQDP